MEKRTYKPSKVIGAFIDDDRYTKIDVRIENPPFDIVIGKEYYLFDWPVPFELGFTPYDSKETPIELKAAELRLPSDGNNLYSCTFKVMVKNYPITINKEYVIST